MDEQRVPPAILPQRKITGISAILLPFTEDGSVDWKGFSAHVERTVQAGLTPAVNMDTGYVNLLDDALRKEVLSCTRGIVGSGSFVAGAFIGDTAGDKWNADAYARRIDEVQSHDATAVIFQSYGLTNQANEQIVAAYATLAGFTDQYIAFELGTMFAPFGKIYDLDTYGGIMAIPQCVGAKHSSLEREPEWDRLELRNAQRPEFKVFTGNDLAIDMVMYGSDYLLGLSSFAPDLFAMRDKMWEEGSDDFRPLNDLLQELGDFAFRSPTPAYKHSAAQFLKLQNWIGCDATHPNSATRPATDVDTLRDIAQRCADWRERA
jgi:dihydrodipicolinate synthase/N-acetylneuraminate lyase